MKKTPEMLKARATQLMELARKLEEEKMIKIGKLTLKHFSSDGNVDLEGFKSELKKLVKEVE